MNLVLLGAPGAGKGTLANLLKDSFDLLHISTGDLLREEKKNETKLGLKVKACIDKGELVPDSIVLQIVGQKLQAKNSGYILDGFPRNKAQAQALDILLGEIKKSIDLVVYIEVELELIITRITGRLVGPKSGRVYHVTNRPPKVAGICDITGEKLVQRADDNEETVRKRMDIYLKDTLPIVEYYESKEILKKLDGRLDSEILRDKIVELMNAKK